MKRITSNFLGHPIAHSPLCCFKNKFFSMRGKSLPSRFSLIVPIPEYSRTLKKHNKR